MDMIRVLVALYPKDWRDRYGEEFGALLEDSRLTPFAVADVIVQAARLRIRTHLTVVLFAAAFGISWACNGVVVVNRLAENILWAPTDLPRAFLLVGTIGPWLAPAIWSRRRRTRRLARK
jgi:hypothetical protein